MLEDLCFAGQQRCRELGLTPYVEGPYRPFTRRELDRALPRTFIFDPSERTTRQPRFRPYVPEELDAFITGSARMRHRI